MAKGKKEKKGGPNKIRASVRNGDLNNTNFLNYFLIKGFSNEKRKGPKALLIHLDLIYFRLWNQALVFST